MSSVLRVNDALDASLDALQAADDLDDEDAAWAAIHIALDALHGCEERAKASDQLSYFSRRDASTTGRTAGGLIWVRGLIKHHDADVRLRMFRPFAISGEDRAPQPLVCRPAPGSNDRMIVVDEVVWPDRPHLPAPGRRFKSHQRDIFYDLQVAGQPLIEPLRAARAFFATES